MLKVDYDKNKFTPDAYGNLIPKSRTKIPGAVYHGLQYWYIFRRGELRGYLHKDGTWHTNTGWLSSSDRYIAPGWYRTRKEARDTLWRYKESL